MISLNKLLLLSKVKIQSQDQEVWDIYCGFYRMHYIKKVTKQKEMSQATTAGYVQHFQALTETALVAMCVGLYVDHDFICWYLQNAVVDA